MKVEWVGILQSQVKTRQAIFSKLISTYLLGPWLWRDALYLYDCERQASGVQQRVVAVVEPEKERKKIEKKVDVRKAS